MRLLALTCGWLTGDAGLFAAGATGRLRVPVPCFLIEHPQGLVLFDSGLHAEAATAPEARLGSAASLFAVELAPHEDVGARLAALGVAPGAVRFLVTSHLHFDHTGGHATIPNAALVVQRAEWTAARDPELARGLLYDPANYDLGHEVRCVDGEHDLFGDGRVVCLPTPGHTPGHQSLRVRLASGEVVLTADACYLRSALEAMQLPPVVHDREEMLASLRRLRALEAAGARLYFGHDPAPWAQDPQGALEIG